LRCDWKIILLAMLLIIIGLVLVALGYLYGWIAVFVGLLILAWCGYQRPTEDGREVKRVTWHELAYSTNLDSTLIYLQACVNGMDWKRNVYGEPTPGPGNTATIYLELNQVPPYSEAQIDNPAFSFPDVEFNNKYVELTIRDWWAGDVDTTGPGEFIERTTVVEGTGINARSETVRLDPIPKPDLPTTLYGKAIVKFLEQFEPHAEHEGNGIFVLS
jgi:hypothetical protein